MSSFQAKNILLIFYRPHSVGECDQAKQKMQHFRPIDRERGQHINTLQTMAKVASINCSRSSSRSSQEAVRAGQARPGHASPSAIHMEPAELLLTLSEICQSKEQRTIAGRSRRGWDWNRQLGTGNWELAAISQNNKQFRASSGAFN